VTVIDRFAVAGSYEMLSAMPFPLKSTTGLPNALVPGCVTVAVCPPRVMEPMRDTAPVLRETWSVTVPLPAGDETPVTPIQGAVLVAVQPQPDEAVTVSVAGPPAIPTA